MDHSPQLNHLDKRRAIRMEWERPVRIVQPVMAAGKSVNVSSCGILLRIGRHPSLRIGDVIAMEITRADGMAAMQRSGRIVRVDRTESDVLVGVDLM